MDGSAPKKVINFKGYVFDSISAETTSVLVPRRTVQELEVPIVSTEIQQSCCIRGGVVLTAPIFRRPKSKQRENVSEVLNNYIA